MSDSNEMSSSLPRGLVTRKGMLQTSTQRLPSLRSEAQSSQLSPFAANTTTKGGVVKRTYKPIIPTKRNISDGSQSSNQFIPNTSPSKRGRNGDRNLRNTPRSSYDATKFVQLGATLFNGDRSVKLANNTGRQSSNRRVTFKEEIETSGETRNNSNERVTIKTEPIIKLEKKSTGSVLRKLYGDNFIDDDEEDEGLLPKRWQSVSNHRSCSKPVDQTLSPYNLFRSDDTEKYLLLQFPEAILKRRDGHVGKIRVFKSGRIELEDNESGTKFDIVYSNHNVPQVKTENNIANKSSGIYTQDISQDVVSFTENHLNLLGSLKQQQVLLAVPQLPLDEQIGPSIQL